MVFLQPNTVKTLSARPMEFRFRAGEDMRTASSYLPPHPSSDGYLAAPPLHAAFSAVAGGVGRGPGERISATAAFHRGFQKERIRARVIVEDMILEEEVRMELQVERMMAAEAAARHPGERLQLLPVAPIHPDPAPVMLLVPQASLGERPRPRVLVPLPPPSPHLEKAPAAEMNTWRRPNLCGTKRKAAAAAVKEWGCALCEVAARSEEDLNVHLQGKKHKAKAAVLLGPVEPAAGVKAGKVRLRCDICNLQCNSQAMLGSHLDGKKHKAQLEEIVKDSSELKRSNRKGGGGGGGGGGRGRKKKQLRNNRQQGSRTSRKR